MSKHLSDAARDMLDAPQLDRINYIRKERWVGYSQANLILKKLDDLLIYPKRQRMPNLLIVGDTNNGKSLIAEQFLSRHPVQVNQGGEAIKYPVFYIQSPPEPSESRLYGDILQKLFVPHRTTDRVEKKLQQVVRIFQQIDIKVLVIDEIHHLLAGSTNKQRQFLNVIKYLGNELRIPIVALGIKDAFRALQVDAQLANRFDHIALPKWRYDKEYLRLLATFERILPLKKPSDLHKSPVAKKILYDSEGYIGEIARILMLLSEEAIETGVECINEDVYSSIQWHRPSERMHAM